MPKRSAKRDAAKAAFLERIAAGEAVNLKDMAEAMGVKYQTMRNWKAADKWDDAVPKPKKKRGGQPGNQNSAGHANAAGSHDGAPIGNKNAEKDGAYSAVLFDLLTEREKAVYNGAPTKSAAALAQEMAALKVREFRIMEKIAMYEAEPEDTLHLSSLMDMRLPGGRGSVKVDGKNQQMGMYTSDTAFTRVMKLQEALYKVQGRIAHIADSLRAQEEADRRMEIEKQRLEIMRMRATGAVAFPDIDAGVELDDPTEASEE